MEEEAALVEKGKKERKGFDQVWRGELWRKDI